MKRADNQRFTNLTQPQKDLVTYMEWIVKIRKTRTKPKTRTGDEFHYAGMEDYLLRHGTWYDVQPLPAWVPPGVPSMCYGNAINLVDMRKGLRYVEGLAMNMIPIQHAWNIDPKGRLIDNTWDPLGTAYIGVEFPVKEAKRLLRKHCCILNNFKEDHPLFRLGTVPGTVRLSL